MRRSDLGLGAGDSLPDRRLAGQQGTGDLTDREPGHQPQRERQSGLGRERGMSADEDQPELVVLDWLERSRVGLQQQCPRLLGFALVLAA